MTRGQGRTNAASYRRPRPRKLFPDLDRVWVVPDAAAIRFWDGSARWTVFLSGSTHPDARTRFGSPHWRCPKYPSCAAYRHAVSVAPLKDSDGSEYGMCMWLCVLGILLALLTGARYPWMLPLWWLFPLSKFLCISRHDSVYIYI
jgi:hypothetical protein